LSRVRLAVRLWVVCVRRACDGSIRYGRVVCCSPGMDGVLSGAGEVGMDICVVEFVGM